MKNILKLKKGSERNPKDDDNRKVCYQKKPQRKLQQCKYFRGTNFDSREF